MKYPYLDFPTPELRRRACQAELALNRRTTATLYLAIRSVNRLPDGSLAFQGRMQQLAADALAAGRSVILDAVAASPEERAGFAETAAGVGVKFAGLWLEAPPALLGERIRMRPKTCCASSLTGRSDGSTGSGFPLAAIPLPARRKRPMRSTHNRRTE